MTEESFALHFGAGEVDDDFGEATAARHPHALAVLEALRDEGIPTEGAEITARGYGYGADATAIGVTLGALVSLFLAGKKIEENIDAWLRLGRRLRDALKRLRERQIRVAMSEPAATAYALARIAEDSGTGDGIKLLASRVVPVSNPSLVPEAQQQFLEHPDRYYIFTFGVGEDRVEVLCITAHGRIAFQHSLPLDRFSYYGAL